MKLIQVDSGWLTIPEDIVYYGDRTFFNFAATGGNATIEMVVTIDGSTLRASITNASVIAVDATLTLRRRGLHSPASLTYSVTVTVTRDQDVAVETYNGVMWYYYGKTYTHRTHYAEGVVYLPDGATLDYIAPFNGVAASDEGGSVTLTAGDRAAIPVGDCDTAVTIASGEMRECVDDCGWAAGIRHINIFGEFSDNPGVEVRITNAIPDEEAEHWYWIDAFKAERFYAPEALTINLAGYGSFEVQCYDLDSNPTRTLTIYADDTHDFIIAFDANNGYGGVMYDGVRRAMQSVIYDHRDDSSLHYVAGGIVFGVPNEQCPTGFASLWSALSRDASLDYSGRRCRHDYTPWSQGVAYIVAGNAVIIPTADGRWLLFSDGNGNIAGDGYYLIGDPLTLQVAGALTLTFTTDKGGARSVVVTSIAYYTQLPACEGRFFGVDDTPHEITSITLAGDDHLINLDNGLLQVAAKATTYADIVAWLATQVGATIETTTGDSVTYSDDTQCCVPPATIERGDIWHRETTDVYTIEVRRACWQGDDKGVWLRYYNADGAERYIPAVVKTTKTEGGTMVVANSWWRAGTWAPSTRVMAEINRATLQMAGVAGVTLSVALLDVPPTLYIEDIFASPVLEVLPPDLTTAIGAVIVSSDITRDSDTTDYMIDLKVLTQ